MVFFSRRDAIGILLQDPKSDFSKQSTWDFLSQIGVLPDNHSLWRAVKKNRPDALEYLLKKEVHWDEVEFKRAAIHHQDNNHECLELLLQYKSNALHFECNISRTLENIDPKSPTAKLLEQHLQGYQNLKG